MILRRENVTIREKDHEEINHTANHSALRLK